MPKAIRFLSIIIEPQIGKRITRFSAERFFSLIEEQTKTVMLANVSREYVFKTIDPAFVPEEKLKPQRSLIVLASTFLAVILSVLLVILMGTGKQSRNSTV